MKCKCATCPTHACYTKGVNCTGVPHEEVKAAYTDEELKLMHAAAYVEGTFYSNICRLQETAEFAKAMSYKKLGMAFCIGLNAEARYIAKYFDRRGGAHSSEPEGGERPSAPGHPGGGRLPPPDHCHHSGGAPSGPGPPAPLHRHRPAVRRDAPIHSGGGKARQPLGQGDGAGESAKNPGRGDPSQFRAGGERGG